MDYKWLSNLPKEVLQQTDLFILSDVLLISEYLKMKSNFSWLPIENEFPVEFHKQRLNKRFSYVNKYKKIDSNPFHFPVVLHEN